MPEKVRSRSCFLVPSTSYKLQDFSGKDYVISQLTLLALRLKGLFRIPTTNVSCSNASACSDGLCGSPPSCLRDVRPGAGKRARQMNGFFVSLFMFFSGAGGFYLDLFLVFQLFACCVGFWMKRPTIWLVI